MIDNKISNIKLANTSKNIRKLSKMVHSSAKKYAHHKNIKSTKKRFIKKKQELSYLLSKLNEVTPICKKKNNFKSTDVVFQAVKYINQLHKKIADKKGLKALQQIQKNASNKAIQQLMSMKNKAKNVSQVKNIFLLIITKIMFINDINIT